MENTPHPRPSLETDIHDPQGSDPDSLVAPHDVVPNDTISWAESSSLHPTESGNPVEDTPMEEYPESPEFDLTQVSSTSDTNQDNDVMDMEFSVEMASTTSSHNAADVAQSHMPDQHASNPDGGNDAVANTTAAAAAVPEPAAAAVPGSSSKEKRKKKDKVATVQPRNTFPLNLTTVEPPLK